MNRRQKIIVSITGIFIVLLALVGLTYAYFLTRITGNENDKSISVTTANLSVTYNDDIDGDGEPDALMLLENIMPSNTETYTKTFKVENTGNATATYSVVLDNMVNEFERNQDLKYTLTREGTTGNIAEGNLVVGTKQILIPKVEIEDEGIHTYTLTLKYVEAGVDQSIDMEKGLSFRVNIDKETITWDTAEEGTLLYALKNNQPNGTEETEINENSTANEARIIITEDDYGASYVYRGAVTNNYVTYSNMCWRIVRVQGNGTIKLALADGNHPCGTENGYSVDNLQSGLLDDANGNARQDIKYNNFYYEQSDIPGALTEWAERHNLNMDGLSETEWCNDTSIIGFGDDYRYTEGPLYILSGAYERMNIANSNIESANNPNLKCNFKGIEINGEETKAIRYLDKIGIFTADELKYAGFEGINTNNYLAANIYDTPGIWIWTMTDYYILDFTNGEVRDFSQKHLAAFGISKYIENQSDVVELYVDLKDNRHSGFVRPLVVLRSDSLLSQDTTYTQDGTIDKPYVIE